MLPVKVYFLDVTVFVDLVGVNLGNLGHHLIERIIATCLFCLFELLICAELVVVDLFIGTVVHEWIVLGLMRLVVLGGD